MLITKKSIAGLALAYLSMLTLGCSSPLKVASDFDKSANFSGYKTFSVYNLKTTGSVSQLNADRVANAMRAEMTKKGYKETQSSPDLMVNGIAVLKDKQQVSANTNYYGYGGIYRPYGYYSPIGMSSSTTVSTYNYKAGTFIIDVVDAKTNKVVWEGTGTKDFDKPLKNPETEIPAGVAKIMESFPTSK